MGLRLERVLDLFKICLSGKIFKEVSEVKSKMQTFMTSTQEARLVDEEQPAKVSLVIPALNESNYIMNPLQSLKAGSYNNFEAIVVDCMSDDDTVAKARRLGAKTLISKRRNRGYQTHLGFISAQGDIIIRTDADTIFPRDILSNTVKAFNNKKTMVYHVGHIYYDSGVLMKLVAHLYDKYWRKTWATSGHFIAVRREAYEKVAFEPLHKGQDFDFGKRAYEIFGPKGFLYDPNTVVLVSSRAIRKIGLLRYILRQGSFKSTRGS